MANKKAIVWGASGQDGSFMCDLLESIGYTVYGILNKEPRHIIDIIWFYKPDEIYNFAGISNVINPYEQLDEIFEVNAKLPQQILETIVKVDKKIKFFQASSSLMFGRDESRSQNELTPFNPIYPYGCAKLYAHNMVNEFRKTFGLFACSGIFFNHESERRKEHFFSRKICKAAATKTKVTVGNLDALRDFGYAKDYMEAAYLMMQEIEPKDYVIGTGRLISMREFAKRAFEHVGLDYRDYVIEDESLKRKNDTNVLCADATKIELDLGWKAKTSIDEMIKIMIEHDRAI